MAQLSVDTSIELLNWSELKLECKIEDHQVDLVYHFSRRAFVLACARY